MIVADYDTLEMRLLACASMEKSMIELIKAGQDIHMGNATLVFGPVDGFDYEEIANAKKIDKKVKNGELPESALTERMHHLLRRRREIKSVGFGLNYGMKENKLARDLGITVQEAKKLMDAYLATYPAVRGYFEETVSDAKSTGYAFTVLGRRRYLPDILSNEDMHRWRAERQACNSGIQGCLPASTRILTKKGYIPIGEAPETGVVWTGLKWAPYIRLNRGMCELATIELSNGQTLRCDTRHEVLVLTEGEYKFRKWKELKMGDSVCLSIAKALEFGSAIATPEHLYWLGFALGNGCTCHGNGHPRALSITFGDRIGRYAKEEKARAFQEYIRTAFGVEPQKPNVFDNKITIVAESHHVEKYWKSLGYCWGKTAAHKRLPATIWRATLKERQALALGFLDSDGSVAHGNTNLHLCQREILEEFQVLLRTLGVESTLRDLNDGSYRLDLHEQQTSTAEHPPVYATKQVLSIKALGIEETTYTLSVQDPLHRFDSEGVISKNSAADVVKMAMIRCYHEGDLEKKYGCRMLLQVHDELMFECPPEHVEEVKPLIRELMEHSLPTDLATPLTISMGVGKSWAETH